MCQIKMALMVFINYPILCLTLGIRNPIELDLYALETSSRKMINDLIHPVLSKMNEDREVIVQAKMRQRLIEERLTSMEYVLSLNEAKPKIFEDIHDGLAAIRADLRFTEQSILQKVETMGMKVDKSQETVDECKHMTNFLLQKAESFDHMISQQRENTIRLEEKLALECTDLKNFMEERFKEIREDQKKTDLVVIRNQMKVREFSEIIDRVEGYQRELNRQNGELKKLVFEVQERKLDADKFDQQINEVTEMVRTNKYAVQDNFRSLMLTDNYIEKYQPFFIQAMINESISQVVKKEKMNKLKEFEHNKYREWHKQVLNDTGMPNLQKRVYMMPGSQPIANHNKDFIPEMGEKIISLEWFLGRTNDPFIKEASVESKSSPSSKSSTSHEVLQLQKISKRSSILEAGKNSTLVDHAINVSQQLNQSQNNSIMRMKRGSQVDVSRPVSNAYHGSNYRSPNRTRSHSSHNRRMTAMQDSQVKTGERGLEKFKDDYLMGIEDLEPEFANQIREDHVSLVITMQDIERIKKDLEMQQFKTLLLIREEIQKFKDEIKSCLNEHLAFIQEIHTDIEKDKINRADQMSELKLQIKNCENKVGITNSNEQKKPKIIDARERMNTEILENIYDAMKLQNILNHEFFKQILQINTNLGSFFFPMMKDGNLSFGFEPQIASQNIRPKTGSSQHKRVHQITIKKFTNNIENSTNEMGTSVYNLNNMIQQESEQHEINTQINHPTPPLGFLSPKSSSDNISNEKKIDCHQIIQIIDSLIKGCDNPNIEKIANKIKRNQNNLIKQDRASRQSKAPLSFSDFTASPDAQTALSSNQNRFGKGNYNESEKALKESLRIGGVKKNERLNSTMVYYSQIQKERLESPKVSNQNITLKRNLNLFQRSGGMGSGGIIRRENIQ
ncbi:UNKNOWN [Stylonychia lemnae]|uniref:Uncharacterized protein n=1 Tax=Stylonychia lemnae TaxID=5949 RepID=A0A078AKB2_STYLE|nr:UNKNOWN [Stylonychia lemnae]|eukprot:CDW82634.1 UNKNOWN [Stylonychia lemnae]